MFYKVILTANLHKAPPIEWLRQIRDYFDSHAFTLTPDAGPTEPSFYSYQKCFHDENPILPCEIIAQKETS